MIAQRFFILFHRLANSPFNPAPFVTVCVGFLLPLDLFLSSQRIAVISSLVMRLQVISTAVIINTILAIFCAGIAMTVSMAIATVFRISYVKAVSQTLSFITNLVIICTILNTLRVSSFLKENRLVLLSELILVLLLTVTVCFLRKPLRPSSYLFIPQILTSFLLVVAIPITLHEYLQTLHPQQSLGFAPHALRVRRSPDIILITFDAMSARHLHTYGYQRPNTPSLDMFASAAITFDNFYANANWTRPGIASILNGVRTWTHQADISLPANDLTKRLNLLSLLSQSGYDVNIVQSNLLADRSSQSIAFPAHEIFLDSCYRLFNWVPGTKLNSAIIAGPFALEARINSLETALLRVPYGKDLAYLASAERLLNNADSQQPLFLWVHILIPHDPYAAAAPFLGHFDDSTEARTFLTSQAHYFFHHDVMERTKMLQARYDEAILMSDARLGEILEMLKRHGRIDHSLIIISADHGENFNPVYGGHAGPLLTEEVLRVPCLIKPPMQFTPKHETQLMEQADLLPTILSYAGLQIPDGSEGYAYPGKPDNLPVFSMNRDIQMGEKTLNVAMREGDWKYVIHLGKWKHDWPQQELYNLVVDPYETSNLTAVQPDRAKSMQQRILSELAAHKVSLKEYQP